jgi:hypothetical protein
VSSKPSSRSNGFNHTYAKSPLTPLFQRGEILFVAEIPPFEKGGLRGIFLANGEYNFTKTSIAKLQEFKNIIIKSMARNETLANLDSSGFQY